jgi:hypothetical protein
VKVIGLGYKVLSIPPEISGSKPSYLVIVEHFELIKSISLMKMRFGFD